MTTVTENTLYYDHMITPDSSVFSRILVDTQDRVLYFFFHNGTVSSRRVPNPDVSSATLRKVHDEISSWGAYWNKGAKHWGLGPNTDNAHFVYREQTQVATTETDAGIQYDYIEDGDSDVWRSVRAADQFIMLLDGEFTDPGACYSYEEIDTLYGVYDDEYDYEESSADSPATTKVITLTVVVTGDSSDVSSMLDTLADNLEAIPGVQTVQSVIN